MTPLHWLLVLLVVLLLPKIVELFARFAGRGFARGKADTFVQMMETEDEDKARKEEFPV